MSKSRFADPHIGANVAWLNTLDGVLPAFRAIGGVQAGDETMLGGGRLRSSGTTDAVGDTHHAAGIVGKAYLSGKQVPDGLAGRLVGIARDANHAVVLG
jgi:hypothetical protein